MIYLETGQPGHGKTLRAMQLALEFQAKGRDVYVSGVRGLKTAEAGFFDLPDPKRWEDLPDGAVILIDECYTVFPKRSSAQKVPAYVEAMATHRHRGFDFILICQQASQQLDIFLLGLVDRHEHIRRKFGLKKSVILWWDKYSSNVTMSHTKFVWSFPRSVMKRNLYESTVQDNTQKKIPWYIWALPIALLVLYLLVTRVMAFFHAPEPVAKASTAQASSGLSGLSGGGDREKRPDDIAAWLKPRVPGMPWSAPAYDGRTVQAAPELYCMAVEDGKCGCITEQGTSYMVEPNLCRSIARHGLYNPTRPPASRQDQPRGGQYQDQPAELAPVVVTAGNWPAGIGSQTYTPPATPGSWHADAFGRSP